MYRRGLSPHCSCGNCQATYKKSFLASFVIASMVSCFSVFLVVLLGGLFGLVGVLMTILVSAVVDYCIRIRMTNWVPIE